MMLEVRDLHAFYGKSHILQGVNLSVGEGEIVSLLGRNGVGRSTTCKAIMGLVEPVGRFHGHLVHHGQPPNTEVVALDPSQPALACGMVGQDSEYRERAPLAQPAVEYSPGGALAAQKRAHVAISRATFSGVMSHWALPLGVHSRVM